MCVGVCVHACVCVCVCLCVCVCMRFLFLCLYLIALIAILFSSSPPLPLPPPFLSTLFLLDLSYPPPPPPPPIHFQVFVWGCSDKGALGRDGDEYTPLPVVKLKDHVIRQVSAGDSHTAALTNSGCVCTSGVCSE